MKIIKEGKTPPLPWMGRHACDKCGTVWELERSDVKLVRYHSDQREGDWFETQCHLYEALMATLIEHKEGFSVLRESGEEVPKIRYLEFVRG
jgi:hypothetical protein